MSPFQKMAAKFNHWLDSDEETESKINPAYLKYSRRASVRMAGISAKRAVENNILGIDIKDTRFELRDGEVLSYLLSAVPEQAICFHGSKVHQIAARFETGDFKCYQYRSNKQRRRFKPLIYPREKYDRTHIIPIGFHGSENNPRLLVGWDKTQNRNNIRAFERKVIHLNKFEPILWYSKLTLNADLSVNWETYIFNISGNLIESGSWTDRDKFIWK